MCSSHNCRTIHTTSWLCLYKSGCCAMVSTVPDVVCVFTLVLAAEIKTRLPGGKHARVQLPTAECCETLIRKALFTQRDAAWLSLSYESLSLRSQAHNNNPYTTSEYERGKRSPTYKSLQHTARRNCQPIALSPRLPQPLQRTPGTVRNDGLVGLRPVGMNVQLSLHRLP